MSFDRAALLLGLCLLGQACQTTSRGRVVVPRTDKLHVAVFVDQTETGEVGWPLTQAVQAVMWRDDPDSFATSFEQSTVTMDGTVLVLEEKPVGAGITELRFVVDATLVAHDGQKVADLGRAEVTETFNGRPKERSPERREALDRGVWRMARYLVSKIDEAGREEAALAAAD